MSWLSSVVSHNKIGGSVGSFLEHNKSDIAALTATALAGGNPLAGAAVKAAMEGTKKGATLLDAVKGGITGYGTGSIGSSIGGAAKNAASQGIGATAKAVGSAGLSAAKDSFLGTTPSNTGAGMDWGKILDYGKKAVDIGGAVVGMNQARQDAKGATGAANRVVGDANQRYAERAPFRAIGTQRLTNPQQYDYSKDFTAQPDAVFNQASKAQSDTLSSLQNGPDRIAMVRQALADLDKENAPRLAAGIRGIGQRAATLGRIGNAGVTTSIGDLASDIERDRQTKSNALLRDATEADVNDRFRRAGLASDIAGQRFGFGQQGVQNNAARIAAERNARGQDFSEGMSLADFGYGGTPDAANQWNANRLDRNASENNAAVGDIASGLGDLFGQRGAINPADAVAAANFRPVKAPVQPVQGVPIRPTFNNAPWGNGRVTSTGPR